MTRGPRTATLACPRVVHGTRMWTPAAIALAAMACGKTTYVPPAPDADIVVGSVETPAPVETAPAFPEVRRVKEEDFEPIPAGPLAETCDGVSLVLVSVTSSSYGLDAIVELRNGSSRHVPLVLPGDGSSGGRRNPAVAFELSPDRVAPRAGCGNMNPGSPREHVFLAPNERRRLEWLNPPTPAKAGHYTLRVTYENDPTSTRLGDNPPGPRTERLLERARKSVRCKLTSNAVAFDWAPPAGKSGRDGKAECNCEAGDPLCSCL